MEMGAWWLVAGAGAGGGRTVGRSDGRTVGRSRSAEKPKNRKTEKPDWRRRPVSAAARALFNVSLPRASHAQIRGSKARGLLFLVLRRERDKKIRKKKKKNSC